MKQIIGCVQELIIIPRDRQNAHEITKYNDTVPIGVRLIYSKCCDSSLPTFWFLQGLKKKRIPVSGTKNEKRVLLSTMLWMRVATSLYSHFLHN